MSSEIIDAADWDATPVRAMLVYGLAGCAYVQGPVVSFLEGAARSGLLSYRPAQEDEVPEELLRRHKTVAHAYFVEPTDTGTSLAIRLAHSHELCMLLDAFCNVPDEEWSGVDPALILSELDLRRGGDGKPKSYQDTAQTCRHCLAQLPRRGVDAQGTAHRRD